jgi:hypothetical protein
MFREYTWKRKIKKKKMMMMMMMMMKLITRKMISLYLDPLTMCHN